MSVATIYRTNLRTDQQISKAIRRLYRAGEDLNYSTIRTTQGPLLNCARETFGTWREAVEAAGLDYDKISRIHRWSEGEIIKQLKELHRQRDFLDISRLRERHPKLYGACCRQYGTGLAALEAAGIDYDALKSERPNRWTKQQIVDELRRRFKAGKTLCRASILRKEPKMSRFCHAANHQFGNWTKALKAANLNPDQVRNRDGRWPKDRVLQGIRKRHQQGKLLNTDLMLREDLTLHAAGRRHFGTWEKAVRAAGVDYNQHVRGGLRGWTKAKTQRALRARIQDSRGSQKQVQKESPSLFRAAVHHFGSWKKAERAAKGRR